MEDWFYFYGLIVEKGVSLDQLTQADMIAFVNIIILKSADESLIEKYKIGILEVENPDEYNEWILDNV